MPISRRSVLRDAALLSLAGAASRLPLKALDKDDCPCLPPLPGTPPPDFKQGIRVFFSGAWLFCEDPNDPKRERVLAVTVDLDDDPLKATHYYPFGAWASIYGVDFNPTLAPSGTGLPYTIEVQNQSEAPCKNVDQLFTATQKTDPFVYLTNSGNTLTVTPTKSVRAISLPMPNCIIPGAFITDGKISGNAQGHYSGSQSGCGFRLATTHVFDYWQATELTLTDGRYYYIDNATQDTDYHFHTVPRLPIMPGHAAAMFARLIGLIGLKATDLAITVPDPPCFDRGRNIPLSVSDEELEMEPLAITRTVRKYGSVMARRNDRGNENETESNLASCASGGLGLGGGH